MADIAKRAQFIRDNFVQLMKDEVTAALVRQITRAYVEEARAILEHEGYQLRVVGMVDTYAGLGDDNALIYKPGLEPENRVEQPDLARFNILTKYPLYDCVYCVESRGCLNEPCHVLVTCHWIHSSFCDAPLYQTNVVVAWFLLVLAVHNVQELATKTA